MDAGVGYLARARIGDRVGEGDALGTLLCRRGAGAGAAADRIRAAYTVSDEPPARVPELIKEVITP